MCHRQSQMMHAKSGRASELTLLRAPPFPADLAVGHQHRRPAQVAGGLGDRDDDLAAGHPHREGPASAPAPASAATAAATVPVPQERVSPTPRSCTRILTTPPAGAVRTSTLTPSGNWAWSKLTGAATSSAASASAVRSGSTHARCGLPTSTATPANRRPPTTASPGPEQVGLAHVDGDVGVGRVDAVHDDRPRTGQRPDHELVAGFQAAGAQVVREDPNAVAAHLGDRAVGVAVVHVPVAGAHAVGQAVEHAGRQRRAGGGDAQHPVGAQAATPVAQGGHPGGAQRQPGVEVGQQHEVVLGAVTLGEDHLLRIRAAKPAERRRRGPRGRRRPASAPGGRGETTTAAVARSAGCR